MGLCMLLLVEEGQDYNCNKYIVLVRFLWAWRIFQVSASSAAIAEFEP